VSAIELILRYLRQRARFRLFVPLSMLLALAGRWIVPMSSVSLGVLGIAALQALGLMLAFRIWDDLEDCDADRNRHPTRVMAAARSTTPFYALGFALSCAAVVWLVAEPDALRRLAALSIATAVLSIWYGLRPTDGSHPALAEHVLAIKYPLVAYAVAPELPSGAVTVRAAVVLGALYVLICVYEYADDVELRQLFTSRRSAS
jgi:hypothetical protein